MPGPRRRAARAARLRASGIASLIALGAVVGAAVGALLVGGGVRTFPRAAAHPATPVPASLVAQGVHLPAATQSYRFPLGCLRITRTPEALAGAMRRRTDPCWRYGVSVTAILRQVGGMWRLALQATSRVCPRIALPAPVRAQLAVCRR